MPCGSYPKGYGKKLSPITSTTVISPGAVATELSNSTTEPDTGENVRKAHEIAIPADSFARGVAFAMTQPEDGRE
jgi:NADP-dependent 3-hydroxy acid dehydrogenase YdfG